MFVRVFEFLQLAVKYCLIYLSYANGLHRVLSAALSLVKAHMSAQIQILLDALLCLGLFFVMVLNAGRSRRGAAVDDQDDE